MLDIISIIYLLFTVQNYILKVRKFRKQIRNIIYTAYLVNSSMFSWEKIPSQIMPNHSQTAAQIISKQSSTWIQNLNA